MKAKALVLPAAVAGLLMAPGWAPRAAQGDGALLGRPRTHVVEGSEDLLELARRYDLGFVEIRAANPGVDPWLPEIGSRLVLPTARLLPDAPGRGIVVNLAERRLYFFAPDGGPVRSYPIGTGKAGWTTRTGVTEVVRKRRNPTWIPPPSIRAQRPDLPAAVPPGPNNPLGRFAINLGWPGYVIHGTNRPYGIGRRVSHGCIRLYPEDIARLFDAVAIGTPVTVIDRPVKVGWSQGELYLEVHPTQAQADEVEASGRFTPDPLPDLPWRLVRAAGHEAARLNWPLIDRVAAERRGNPVRVTRPADGPERASRPFAGYLRSD